MTGLLSKIEKEFPLVTVGVVVLNREWIINKTLDCILHQTYPHNRIFVVIADGESKDRTVETAREILQKSDFSGYDIISKESSIPEGRNICVENMRGNLLLFWDSDVIMESNAIQDLVETMLQTKAGIVSAIPTVLYIDSINELNARIQELSHMPITENYLSEISWAGMGHTLISKELLDNVHFDTDLTTAEDMDFCFRAKEKGFK